MDAGSTSPGNLPVAHPEDCPNLDALCNAGLPKSTSRQRKQNPRETAAHRLGRGQLQSDAVQSSAHHPRAFQSKLEVPCMGSSRLVPTAASRQEERLLPLASHPEQDDLLRSSWPQSLLPKGLTKPLLAGNESEGICAAPGWRRIARAQESQQGSLTSSAEDSQQPLAASRQVESHLLQCENNPCQNLCLTLCDQLVQSSQNRHTTLRSSRRKHCHHLVSNPESRSRSHTDRPVQSRTQGSESCQNSRPR
mmetsp:Transcript_42560/g.92479  ORF Transcript_42560/g.92479 Transcript_42560/m.92479 type:complete len:250 (+) Transcript_42560:1324-2073(+)